MVGVHSLPSAYTCLLGEASSTGVCNRTLTRFGSAENQRDRKIPKTTVFESVLDVVVELLSEFPLLNKRAFSMRAYFSSNKRGCLARLFSCLLDVVLLRGSGSSSSQPSCIIRMQTNATVSRACFRLCSLTVFIEQFRCAADIVPGPLDVVQLRVSMCQLMPMSSIICIHS